MVYYEVAGHNIFPAGVTLILCLLAWLPAGQGSERGLP